MFRSTSWKRRVPLLCLSTAFAATVAGEALAQATLEEVVVTARKRDESLQEVPLAITALTSAEIERRSIRDLKDVAANTPGLTFFDVNNNLATPVIRGLSQTVLNSPDRNVALFYNGVFLSNTNASNFDLLDMERIEVVKGPVSALYGRNAFGGAINYVPTKASADQVKGRAEATFGSDKRYGVRGTINLPISDTLAVRLAAGYDEWDGSIKNVYGGNIGGYKSTAAAWDIQWNPTDALSIDQFGFYVDDTREQQAQFSYDNNCGRIAGTTRPSFYCGALIETDKIAVDPRSEGSSRKGVVAGWNAAYKFDTVTASFLGGFTDLVQTFVVDRDYSTDPRGLLYQLYTSRLGAASGMAPVGTAYGKFFLGGGPDTTRDWNFELRLASNTEDALQWSVGASYYKHYLGRLNRAGLDSSTFPAGVFPWSVYVAFLPGLYIPYTGGELPQFSRDNIRDEAPAGYFTVDYSINDKLTVGADVRYDQEKRKLTNNVTLSVQEREDKYWTWRGNVDYKLDDGKMLYASIAKGVIAGFFNGTVDTAAGNRPVPVELQNYKPSTNITYELGAKTDWLDRRMTVNAALFYIKYKDLQITAAPPPPLVTALTTNAAGATAKGFEVAVDGRIGEHVTAGVGFAYTDPKYDKGTVDLSNVRYCGDGTLCNTDVGGNQLTRASKNTANVYLQYEGALAADWTWYVRGDARYQSKQYPRSLDLEWYDGYTLGNARLGFSKGEHLDISLWVRNITDELYIGTGITQPNSNPSPVQFSGLPDFVPNSLMGERRSYGLTAAYRF